MIRLVENRGRPSVRLSVEQATALARSRAVRVGPGTLAGTWDITANDLVGAVRIGGVDLLIEPKLPVRRVLHLLGYAHRQDVFRSENTLYASGAGLVDIMALVMAQQIERVLEGGLLQGYRVEETTSPVVRGRIDLTSQLTRHYGIPVPVEIRYDEFATDIAENQILRAACRRLLSVPTLGAPMRRRLREIVFRFPDVTDLVPGVALPTWQPSGLNQRYISALELAELVMQSRSIELGTGETLGGGLLVDMAKVFEDFLATALSDALAQRGGMCRSQKTWALDESGRMTMRPDLVWENARRAPLAVIDAKYKDGGQGMFPNADAYQMSAYCHRLGLRHGHLVYAAGHVEERTTRLIGSGVHLHQHVLHLDREPAELLRAVHLLADRIADTAV